VRVHGQGPTVRKNGRLSGAQVLVVNFCAFLRLDDAHVIFLFVTLKAENERENWVIWKIFLR
jgi:hypothetical protein